MQPKYNGFKKNPFAQLPIEPQFVSLAKLWRSLRETLIVHGGLCHLFVGLCALAPRNSDHEFVATRIDAHRKVRRLLRSIDWRPQNSPPFDADQIAGFK
jgi:hypothetical protein